MSVNYQYHFAEIDPDTRMCIGVQTTSTDATGTDNLIPIPVYDPEYCLKYYLCDNHSEFTYDCTDGNWYEDADGLVPWQSSML